MLVNSSLSYAAVLGEATTRSEKNAAAEVNQAAVGSGQDTLKSYDFTNISPRQMLETINHLITSGQVSLDETSALVPMMGAGVAGVPLNAAIDPDAPMNFVERVEQSIAFARFTHNEQGIVYGNKALDVIARFQGKIRQANIMA